MDFFIENKWPILLGLEVLAWLATFFMLYARYRMKSKLWFQVGTGLVVATGIIPQVALGIINYVTVQEIDMFTVVIVILLLYGATLGKKHIRRLDDWAREKF